MLNNTGFDLWANDYDQSVAKSDADNQYPFAGYKHILSKIYLTVSRGSRVLDIGFGTGKLTKALYDAGDEITGLDFSDRMIAIAREKMPQATLMAFDFTNGLPPTLKNERFNFIVSTYAFHHLTDQNKVPFLQQLLSYLSEDGTILIGDVAFQDRRSLEKCKAQCLPDWDEEEHYLVFDEIKTAFRADQIRFESVSFCAGILSLKH